MTVNRARTGNWAYAETSHKIRRKCKKCDAEPGRPCVNWKMNKGERICIMSTRKMMHPDR